MKRFDERDALFSRMARKKGSDAYEDYYKKHPELKESDDTLRLKPPMGDENARFYHPHFSKIVDSTFGLLSDFNKLCEGPMKSNKLTEGTTDTFTKRIFDLATLYGAVKIGIAPYHSDYYYTHKGRTDANYGQEITDTLPHTIVFAVEMDPALFSTSPNVLESIAVTKGYLDAGIIGLILTYFIKSLGYEARNHMDGNYQMVLPLAAKHAGLGDIGRNGLLTTLEYGNRIRLGAVTTDLPLNHSTPSTFDMLNFCNLCKRCSKVCPSKAICTDTPSTLTFENRWKINHEKCYSKWHEFGSDCGICIAQCPFSASLEASIISLYQTQPEKLLEQYFQTKSPSQLEGWRL